MTAKLKCAIIIAAPVLVVSMLCAQTQRESTPASTRGPVIITRFYTGADRRSHADESEAKFGADDILKLPVLGAELHWMFQGVSRTPQPSEQRMYVITLSGSGEISLTDGKKYPVGLGAVDVVEDTTGLGHLTRNIDDRLTVWMPLAGSPQPAKGAESASASSAAAPAMGPALKPLKVTRVFTSPDGLSHAEVIDAPFGADGTMKLNTKGAELHWQLTTASPDWHNGPRRQYVITLRGTGEVEVGGGQKIPVSPGTIDLIEDTTGKGHSTRNFTDRLTLWLPLAD